MWVRRAGAGGGPGDDVACLACLYAACAAQGVLSIDRRAGAEVTGGGTMILFVPMATLLMLSLLSGTLCL